MRTRAWSISTTTFLVLLLALAVRPLTAQELLHAEGYTLGDSRSLLPAHLEARGLVSGSHPPLATDYIANEYTFVMRLRSHGATEADSVVTTTFALGDSATFEVWEDPCQNARGTFYDCPADVVGSDTRYADDCRGGGPFLAGHLGELTMTEDLRTGEGSVAGKVTWDSGSGFASIPMDRRAGCPLTGLFTRTYECIPAGGDPVLGAYRSTFIIRVFQPAVAAKAVTTWGILRQRYR